jgi:elongation factor G
MNGERVRGKLSLRLDPKSRGSGHSLSATPGLRIPANYMEAFRRGVESSASVGPSASWPVEDFAATILAFAAPSSRQAELALEIAASMATRDCLASAGTAVLEPWMRLEVSSSEESLGSVVSALAGRGGRIEAIEDSGGAKTVIAAAPLRLLFGFASELRSATAGKAGYQAKFLRYEAAPTSRA